MAEQKLDGRTTPRVYADGSGGHALAVVLEDSGGAAVASGAAPSTTLYEATLSASGAVSAIAAPSAGNHLEIFRLEAQAGVDGDQTVSWREGSGGTDKYKALLTSKGDIISRRLGGSWHLATATALYVNPSSANSVRVLVEYRTVAD